MTRSALVAISVNFTVAPAITAPVESVTVPETVVVVAVWAEAVSGARASSAKTDINSGKRKRKRIANTSYGVGLERNTFYRNGMRRPSDCSAKRALRLFSDGSLSVRVKIDLLRLENGRMV